MELRLLTSTFRFKDLYLVFAKGTTDRSPSSQPDINLSRSHFLESSQDQVL